MISILRFLSRHLILMLAFVFSISSKIDIQSQVESYLKGVKFISANFEQVMSSGNIYSGKFWLNKQDKTKIKIEYKKGINQDILILDNVITVLDKDASKKYVNSISQTPIYSILTGSLNLSREKFEIVENSNDWLRLNIKKSSAFGGMSVMLVFSKYPNGNLKNLEAWIIDDGKTETLFSFDPKTLSINDQKKVPDFIFSLPKNK